MGRLPSPARRHPIETRTVRFDPGATSAFPAGEIAEALLAGAVAAYPTETFYALGAAAFSAKAVDRIFRMKKREASKPLSFIVSDMDMVREVASSPPPAFPVLAGEFWPGPLTLVLPAAPGLPDRLLGPGRTIAVRIPPLAWLRALVQELGEPLTATSANLAGEKEIADPSDAQALFSGQVEIVLDGGPAPGGLPSTIVDLTRDRPLIVRVGAVPSALIEALFRS